MKFLKSSIILVVSAVMVLTSCGQSSNERGSLKTLQSQQTFETEFTKVKIKIDTIQALKEFKSPGQLVDHMEKKYGIIFLIHPKNNYASTSRGEEFYPKALEFYQKIFGNDRTCNYIAENEDFKSPRLPSDRPLRDKNIIWLEQDATRMHIIHEFIHYLIFTARTEKSFKIDSKLYAYRSFLKINLEEQRKNYMASMKTIGGKKYATQGEVFIAQGEILKLTAELSDFYLKVLDVMQGEELDVVKILNLARFAILLEEDESKENIDYGFNVLRDTSKQLTIVKELLETMNIYQKDLAKMPIDDLKKFVAAIERLKTSSKSYVSFHDFLEAESIKFKK